MINRTIIRLKIVQLLYAYYQNGDKNLETAEKELVFSLSKAYDLYNYLLMMLVEVTKYADRQIAEKEKLNIVAHIDEPVNRRFADNKFINQLMYNNQLNDYIERQKKSWTNDYDYIKYLYQLIVESDIYNDYMNAEQEPSYEDDKEVWRKIYKHIVMKDERLDDVLEDQSLYWNDDRSIVETFVLKTIKRFDLSNGAEQKLVEEYKDAEDKEFATRLFRRSIQNDEYYRSLMTRCIKNWEFNRLAYMDVIIMQTAIAEILSFPAIPTSVSINEYVEVAKWYSTPKSAGYVNGIIDGVVKMLKREQRIMKQ